MKQTITENHWKVIGNIYSNFFYMNFPKNSLKGLFFVFMMLPESG